MHYYYRRHLLYYLNSQLLIYSHETQFNAILYIWKFLSILFYQLTIIETSTHLSKNVAIMSRIFMQLP